MSGLLALCIALSVLPLSACTAPKLTLDPEELYALPELPERYTALNKQLSAIQESGAEYAAPVSGSNIQPVQMMDLDGDGREEALAFFRQSDGEKPLKIHIFTADDDNSYRQAAVIEGSGLAIYSVDYSDIDGDGRMEIIVGWRVSMDLQALAVYSLEPDGARELMRTNYVKYAVADLNKDGKRELTVLRANQDGEGVADCYVSKNGVLTLRSSVLVSMTMAELSQQGKVTVGGRRPGYYGCAGPSGRRTDKSGAFRHYRRFRRGVPVLFRVSHGHQRRRRYRGAPHGDAAGRGRRPRRFSAGGLDQL